MKYLLPFFCSTLLFTFAAIGQDRIYWGDQTLDKIGSVNASDLGSAATPVASVQNPSGIAYYHANPTYPLFFAASTLIYRNDLAGTSDDIITPTGQFNRGVAIDYAGKKIYWANSQNGYIGRADLDGGNKDEVFLTGLSSPWDIEIDPVNQKIYWTEDVASGNIKRANLSDGSNIETVITNIQSLGVAVDPLRGKIYYTKFTSGTNVYSANIDGTGVTGPISGLTAIADIDVDVTTGKIFMVDYQGYPLTKADPDGTNKVTYSSAGGTFITYADVTAPTISSITRQQPTTTDVGQGGTATFRVTFSEPVLNLSASDFELTGTPTATITVNPVSLFMVFDVVVSGVTGTGTIDLGIAAAQDVFDFRGNAYTGTVTAEETFTAVATPAPTVVSFDPAAGPEGASVTITGTNFSGTPAQNTVSFNGISATVTASTTTTISTTVPAGAASGPLVINVNGLVATSVTSFTVCTLPPKPVITASGNVLTSSADAGNQWLLANAEIAGAINKTYTATQPGDYTVRVTVNGCSSVSDALCVPPAKPTITTDGGVLTSSSTANNQWLKNGVEIAGATNQTYTATTPGAYSVRVAAGSCSSESDPTTIVGTEEILASTVRIFPNPAKSIVRVELPSSSASASIDIYTVTGVRKQTLLLSAEKGPATTGEVDVTAYPAGIYLIVLTTKDGRIIRKLLKTDL